MRAPPIVAPIMLWGGIGRPAGSATKSGHWCRQHIVSLRNEPATRIRPWRHPLDLSGGQGMACSSRRSSRNGREPIICSGSAPPCLMHAPPAGWLRPDPPSHMGRHSRADIPGSAHGPAGHRAHRRWRDVSAQSIAERARQNPRYDASQCKRQGDRTWRG